MTEPFTSPAPCPAAEYHGNPFRYCGACGWQEPPCGVHLGVLDVICTLHQGHDGEHSATVRWPNHG